MGKPTEYGKDDIRHPDNAEYVNETAFNHGIKPEEVTQAMFNDRYVNDKIPRYNTNERKYKDGERKFNAHLEEIPTPEVSVKVDPAKKSFYDLLKDKQ